MRFVGLSRVRRCDYLATSMHNKYNDEIFDKVHAISDSFYNRHSIDLLLSKNSLTLHSIPLVYRKLIVYIRNEHLRLLDIARWCKFDHSHPPPGRLIFFPYFGRSPLSSSTTCTLCISSRNFSSHEHSNGIVDLHNKYTRERQSRKWLPIKPMNKCHCANTCKEAQHE